MTRQESNVKKEEAYYPTIFLYFYVIYFHLCPQNCHNTLLMCNSFSTNNCCVHQVTNMSPVFSLKEKWKWLTWMDKHIKLITYKHIYNTCKYLFLIMINLSLYISTYLWHVHLFTFKLRWMSTFTSIINDLSCPSAIVPQLLLQCFTYSWGYNFYCAKYSWTLGYKVHFQ